MEIITRSAIAQVELIPSLGHAQVKRQIVRELKHDDGTIEQISSEGHRCVLTSDDAAELTAVFGDLNAQMAARMADAERRASDAAEAAAEANGRAELVAQEAREAAAVRDKEIGRLNNMLAAAEKRIAELSAATESQRTVIAELKQKAGASA